MAARPCPLASGALHVRSTAGVETVVVLPKVAAFDMGAVPASAVHCGDVFITHTHLDHCQGVAQHARRRRMLSLPPASYYAPPPCVGPLRAAFAAAGALDGEEVLATVVPMAPPGEDEEGEAVREVRAGKGGRLLVRAFGTRHRVPSQGYCVFEVQRSVREDLAAALKAGELRGAELKGMPDAFRVSERCVLAYGGDTTLDAVLEHPPALTCHTLVIECTYFDAEVHPVPKCHERGHTHLADIAAAADRFRGVGRLVLMHFSAACHDADAVWDLVRTALPPWLCERTTLAFNLGAMLEAMDRGRAIHRVQGLPACSRPER